MSRGILSGGFCPGGVCPGGFCPDTVDTMDRFGKLMELSTNIPMAALAEAYRPVDTTQKRKIVHQY